jgi:hypothetical protein
MDELEALRGFRAPLAVADDGARRRVAERLAGPQRVAHRRHRRRRAFLIAAVAAGALLIAGISGAADGVLSLVGVTEDATSPMPASTDGSTSAYVLGRTYHAGDGSTHLLAAAGMGFPDAVPSRSGQLLYTVQTPDINHPTLRLYDPAGDTDTVFAADASTPAWRSDGAIAYAQHEPAPGKIPEFAITLEVRASATAAPVAWDDSYQPIAWAGKTLIASTFFGDANGIQTLLAFSGPHDSHALGKGALLAISPDGSQVLIADGAAPDGIPSSPILHVVDVASGAIGATLDLRQVTPAGLATGVIVPGGAGDWLGDRIVFPAPAGPVVLDASDGRLSLAKVARFTGDRGLRGAEYHEVRFADGTGARVVLRAIVLPPSGHGGQMLPSAVVCDISADTCTRGIVAENTAEPLTLVFNVSRPA